ncbi:hypothetical protein [Synechococcus sp. MIT S9507]|uniref:hypothetical protein n=1 Tax=Synechococcus sp. MIT S9507 TaxID=3082544 RepID=UPI0039B67067
MTMLPELFKKAWEAIDQIPDTESEAEEKAKAFANLIENPDDPETHARWLEAYDKTIEGKAVQMKMMWHLLRENNTSISPEVFWETWKKTANSIEARRVNEGDHEGQMALKLAQTIEQLAFIRAKREVIH